MTKYRVLRKSPVKTVRTYDVIAEGVEAGSAQGAIRKVVSDAMFDLGEIPRDGILYAAVPESNWTEEPVTVENRSPVIRIGGVAGQVTLDEALADEDAKGGD